MIPPDEDATSFYGKVVAKDSQEPIFGIKMSIDGIEDFDYTNKYGDFSFWLPVQQDEYIIKFEDVDGPAHGGLFKEQTRTLTQNDRGKPLMIEMESDN